MAPQAEAQAQGGLAIMVWSCDLRQPELLATPFMAAQAASALEMQVNMLFTAQAVQWLLPEHGDTLIGFGPQRLPLRHYLETAAEAGVELRACSQAWHALGLGSTPLAPQCAGFEGMVAFIARGHDPGWRTLVF